MTGHLTDAMFDRYDILDDEDLKEAMPKYSEFLRHLDTRTRVEKIRSDKGRTEVTNLAAA